MSSTMMQAFGKGAFGQAPAFNASYPLPVAGKLHTYYSSLPSNASCEVLLAVGFSSVNPSDIDPMMPASNHWPKPMGSDVSGTVIASAGAGCGRLSVNDSVWGDIGANTFTASGDKTKELGAYAQFAVALESQLSRIPRGMGLAEAGALPKVALTSFKALSWYAGFPARASASLLVLGGSASTGALAIQLAKRAWSAANVTVTTSAANFGYVKSLGADYAIDYRSEDWWDPAVVPPASFDVVYDCVGEAGTGDRAVAKLRPGGAYVTITGALASGPLPPDTTQAMFINSDTNLGSAPLLEELARLQEAHGAVRMPKIDSTFGLDGVKQAFARVQTRHTAGKVSIAVPPTTRAEGAAAVRAWHSSLLYM